MKRTLIPFTLWILLSMALIGCSGTEKEKTEEPTSSATPSTDLFVASLSWQDGIPNLGEVTRVTDREGYDNQPRFLPGGASFYFTSDRDGNAEIYRYDVAGGASIRITDTPEREYSAEPIGGEGFSAVRVELDGNQRIWQFDADGSNPEVLLRWDTYPVGYYTWIGTQNLAMVLADETPFNLMFADVPTQRVSLEPVDVNVGRCMRPVGTAGKIETMALAYVSHGPTGVLKGALTGEPGGPAARTIKDYTLPGDGSWIRSVAFVDGSSRTWIQLPEGVEDFDVTADGEVIVGDGSSLMYWAGGESEVPATRSAWVSIGDMGSQGVGRISRLSVSPDGGHVAFAASR